MIKKILIAVITFYQKVLSPDQGAVARFLGVKKKVCIFYPSCSAYAKEAILKHGVLKGSRLAGKRILRCNPFNTPRVDLVP